jgi:hypothetical protein
MIEFSRFLLFFAVSGSKLLLLLLLLLARVGIFHEKYYH